MFKHLLRPIVLLPWTILFATPVLAAKDSADSCSSNFCFRAQGCRHCESSLLFQMTMGRSLGDCGGTGNWDLGFDVGVLVNSSEKQSWGGTVFVMYSDVCGSRYGARMVYRRWFSSQIGLDLAPGIILLAEHHQVPGISAQVALDIAGLGAPIFELDVMRQNDKVVWSPLVGFRGGSYIAVAGAALLGLYMIGISGLDD